VSWADVYGFFSIVEKGEAAGARRRLRADSPNYQKARVSYADGAGKAAPGEGV